MQVENNLTEVRAIIFEDSLVQQYNILDRMRFYKVPSVSIAVIHNGIIEWAKAYGYADIEHKTVADTNTIYQVASISKSVNALGIMKLVEQNKLSLSKDIREYLKTWKFPDNELSYGKTITLKNLLSHTAGLSVRGFVGYPTSDLIPSINQILNGEKPANNEPVKPIYSPGSHYQYSGGGSTVIRKILDDNISSNYEQLMQGLVLEPLKMGNSTFSQPLAAKYTNYAVGYDKEMKPLKGGYYVYPEQTAGGLWSTATDIAKFILEIQRSIKGGKNAFLSKNLISEMLTPVMENYGYGIGIEQKGGEKYFWHEGESYGYRSIYYGSFTSGNGVAILTNAYPENGRPFVIEVLNSVATAYGWKEFYNPIKKKLINVPEEIINKYVGEYFSENPAIKISISKDKEYLTLTARQTEQLYPVEVDTFFLASSPSDKCVFSSSKNNGVIDTFQVVQNGKVVVDARKRF
ncbi:serine hydrolase domain-containing protein [Pedobacter chinensis]|uniref:serine hydrolase domain-containing protein n=1 Tax=Pedobacter chinensis TaxID=2282421 RepID=UPI0013143648|nr:serine hydrolase domain-containing protein [Pedobacter chinensis]